MTKDKEIYVAANKILADHGEDAVDYVRHRMALYSDSGDPRELNIWKRIYQVIV